MKPEVRPSTKVELELSKKLDKSKDSEKAHRDALEHLKRIHARYKKKSMEIQRLHCDQRSKEHSVWVCDMSGGPARCNMNTIEQCPHYITLKEIK